MRRFMELRVEVFKVRLVLDKRLLVLGLVGVEDAAGFFLTSLSIPTEQITATSHDLT